MKSIRLIFAIAFLSLAWMQTSAHCDSYDGPVINDARKALETNNVQLVMKWISKAQEAEIVSLFNATYNLKSGNREVYQLVEKYFFETLVRLHRETEGAPYTGLKPAGEIKPVIRLSDNAITEQDPENLIAALNSHIGQVVREKYEKVKELSALKNESPEKGRAYVDAYVDYTHTVEALHSVIEGEHKH